MDKSRHVSGTERPELQALGLLTEAHAQQLYNDPQVGIIVIVGQRKPNGKIGFEMTTNLVHDVAYAYELAQNASDRLADYCAGIKQVPT